MRSSSIFLWLLIGVALGVTAFTVASGRAGATHARLISVFVTGAPAHPKGVRASSDIAKSRREQNVTVIAKTRPERSVARAGKSAQLATANSKPPAARTPARAVVAPVAREAKTELIPFRNSAFPHGAKLTRASSPFTIINGEQQGRQTSHGGVYWERGVHNDPRVLLHIPRHFDLKKPGVLVLFFHGHGATLERDVWRRQQTPAQVSASGVNAVLAAPQFAVDAADSSPGNLGDAGGLERFLNEADAQLAAMYGDPKAAEAFSRLPVVIVGYSGGYLPTARALERGGAANRVKGVVLLDGLYGNIDNFTTWITKNRSAFFVSSYTRSTSRHNGTLKEILASRKIPFATSVKPELEKGSVWFLSTGGDVTHRDFVTRAWAKNPVQDLLLRMKNLLPEMSGRPRRLTAAEETE